MAKFPDINLLVFIHDYKCDTYFLNAFFIDTQINYTSKYSLLSM